MYDALHKSAFRSYFHRFEFVIFFFLNKNHFAIYGMLQILGIGMDTQDTSPSILLFFDKQRFIFNAGEVSIFGYYICIGLPF